MSRCTVASSPSVISPTGLLAHKKKMPGELFCIKTALHKRREKTSCSVCSSLFFFSTPLRMFLLSKTGKPSGNVHEAFEMLHHSSGLTSLRCTASLSHSPRSTVTNCAQEMPIHLQSDIYTLLLYSFVISGPVVLIILIIKDIILIIFPNGSKHPQILH